MVLADETARNLATNPHHSYIVQAPAGSGKTELLTQRFLKLLANVTEPEHIIALTFTKKAAHEMRERIMMALTRANDNAPILSSHQQQTHDMARIALAQDKAFQWHLLKQPHRLKIMTIDAMCQMLSRATPILDQHIPYADITNDADFLYREAARQCLQHALEDPKIHSTLTTIFTHLDNQHDKLVDLMSELLHDRFQWLPLVVHPQHQDKKTYEKALAWMEQHELQRFCQSLPSNLMDSLFDVAHKMARIIPKHQDLETWSDVQSINTTHAKVLAALLLTTQKKLRKSFDHHVGLKRDVCAPALYQDIKSQSIELLSALLDWPDFLKALLRIQQLPEPKYDDAQWDVLNALFNLLPLLAAHLQAVFSERQKVDFAAIAHYALEALGTEDAPTDLTLYLDHQIQHILIDEFQDTSLQQFQLLSLLTLGWEEDDGRTLFVVGDPMQSIYRFRAAEVGLFLRAQRFGIGQKKLIPLQLTCNFRASPTLVSWVNHQFKHIFPKQDDITAGAVSYHHAISTKEACDESGIFAHHHDTKLEEAQTLITLIEAERTKHPLSTMAILVRSRKQLQHIIPLLREKKIPYLGTDIDWLAQLPHIQDVWSLTKTLLMPSNRLSCLAFLRSPWGGFKLQDLHALALDAKHQSLFVALGRAFDNPYLSEDGRLRAHFMHHVFEQAFSQRHSQGLVDWISNTLKQCHADVLLGPDEQADLEQFWQLLEHYESEEPVLDLAWIESKLHQLYSKKTTPSKLHIMTIHKAKGLEFDTVFLPGLSAKTAPNQHSLLRYLKLPTEEHLHLWLLSPLRGVYQEHAPIYDYIGMIDEEKSHYEQQRLLYVAVTRAKKRLYLLDHETTARTGSFRDLLHHQVFADKTQDAILKTESTPLPPRIFLPLDFYQNTPVIRKESSNHSDFSPLHHTEHLVGIITHEMLQWIGNHHPKTTNDIPWILITQALKSRGFDDEDTTRIQKHIEDNLAKLLNCPTGRWIMKPHQDEHNEYALITQKDGVIITKIIDRTFIENGCRWIIDFKTGKNTPLTEKKYRQQLLEYAQLLAPQSSGNIQCGLYYLETQEWVHWRHVDQLLTPCVG